MERRKFIIGAGALATGSAAAMGTGAFTSASADRTTTVDVVDDTDGLIALNSELESDTVEVNSDSGEWTMDLGDDGGINVNSEYVFGGPLPDNLDSPPESSPLIITNNDSEPHDVTVDYELTNDDWVGDGAVEDGYDSVTSDGSYIEFGFYNNISHGRDKIVAPANEDDHYGRQIAGPVTHRLSPGESRWAIIMVNTENAVDDSEDLSGTLHITAE